jgi:hypothetical protein
MEQRLRAYGTNRAVIAIARRLSNRLAVPALRAVREPVLAYPS